MDLLFPLWLPILLSAAAVWIVSLIVWMALPHHKRDFIDLSDEDGFMDYIRRSGIKPGNYIFPDFRDRKAMESEKTQKALKEGPVGHLSVWPTPVTMGGKMVATFIVYLVVSTLIAYLTRVALPGAAPFAKVFQIAATAGILAYCFSFIPNALWFGSYKRTIVASIVDGVVFGLITGAIFAWRWEH
ncbi:MAG: hypothetical protein HYR85_17530 [Planctomycetes bacterium]|nr:hypothetical protein [Planctomycetota bacterium]MBI3845255.1 hypothetical protein [Planctomycetota bacterium]